MKAYCDGACRISNPGDCSCAFVIYDVNGNVFHQSSRYLGPELHTNNYAEYCGMLDLLEWAHSNRITSLEIFCDSKLVVNQVIGLWGVSKPDLMPLQRLAHVLYLKGRHTIQHIKGHNGEPGNEFVDKLCNEVLDVEGAVHEKK